MSATTAASPAAGGPGSRELGNKANPEWPLGHPRRRQILLVLCLSLLVVVIDNTILNTALPTLARVLHAGTSSLQWITDAYTLCFAALLIPAGALGDRFGRRISLLGGLTVFALGSVAAALSTGTGTLIAARVVMGLGATFVMPAMLSILNAVFPPKERPPKERPQEIAGWSAVAGVGIILAPTLGGLLLTHFWWGSVFLINVPLVALANAGLILTVPETAACSQYKALLSWNGRGRPPGALLRCTSTSYSGSDNPESACSCRFSLAVSSVPAQVGTPGPLLVCGEPRSGHDSITPGMNDVSCMLEIHDTSSIHAARRDITAMRKRLGRVDVIDSGGDRGLKQADGRCPVRWRPEGIRVGELHRAVSRPPDLRWAQGEG